MPPRRVLVTGAGGFIGRWSVPPLVAAGYEVHAVAGRDATRPAPIQLHGAVMHRADLLDESSVEALMARVKPSHLLHFAWIATPGVYSTSPDNARWRSAGQYLVRAFKDQGGARVVMAGTCAEYDWTRVGVCHEATSPLAHETHETPSEHGDAGIKAYARAKLEMHAFLERYAAAHDLSAAWGRIFFQYGPDEHPERLVASVIRSLLQGREAPCSHGRQVRSFLHVADVGSAFAALLDGPVAGAVNIGSGTSMSIADLLHEIGRQIGRPELLRLGARAAPPTEPPVLVPDVARLRTEVGWQPRFSVPEGIADTIAWWRSR